MLWRMREKLVRFKNGGYWERGRDWRAAGYIANDDPEWGANTLNIGMPYVDDDDDDHTVQNLL